LKSPRIHRLRRRLFAWLQLPYMNTVSWSSPTTPLPAGHQPPRGVRAHVRPGRHGGGARGADARRPEHPRPRSTGSQPRSGPGRPRSNLVGEYLDNLREIERRIQRTEAHQGNEVTIDAPTRARHVRRARR
jgi:hypothetical protein